MNKLNYKAQELLEEVFVGQGVTYSIGSDSYAYTVTNVANDIVTIQQDKHKATANSDYFGTQKYITYADPEGEIRNIKLYPTKNGSSRWHKVFQNYKTGRWNKGSGCGFYDIGVRNYYQDPSF